MFFSGIRVRVRVRVRVRDRVRVRPKAGSTVYWPVCTRYPEIRTSCEWGLWLRQLTAYSAVGL